MDTCLAPDATSKLTLNHSEIVTNTTIEVWWPEPSLKDCCYNVVFSYPSLMYRYKVGSEVGQSQVIFLNILCMFLLHFIH